VSRTMRRVGSRIEGEAGLLLDVDDSLTCVVDVQPGFLDKLDAHEARGVSARIAWIVAVASRLDVPIVVTEEEPGRNGPTTRAVLAHVPHGTPVHTKPTFGLADVPEILSSVERTGRRTAVLVGLETDVCVAHSALGLLDGGFRVVVVRDAVASPGSGHRAGLQRMRSAGAVLLETKGLFFEWVRTVERARAIEALMADVPVPEGLIL
jgi:nicotinamidase-related amidase